MQHRRCYTDRVPTSRQRHTITETPPVEEALRRLRELEPGSVDFKDLLIRGANSRITELEKLGDGGSVTREDLIEEFLRVGPEDLDVEVGLALHERGWARDP